MGKHTITHLKAPWPLGAKVGDVIDLATVPVWAVGKCAPAGDDADVTVSFEAPVITANIVPANEDAGEVESFIPSDASPEIIPEVKPSKGKARA